MVAAAGTLALFSASPSDRGTGTARAFILFATLFNFALCFIDTNFVRLSSSIVIASEILCLGASMALSFRYGDRDVRPWFILLAAELVWWMILSAARLQFDPKLVRDVIIIPIFIMFGVTFRHANMTKILVSVQSVVAAIMLFELISPERFSSTFNVMRFYIATRGLDEAAFWNTDSEFFVSATRPGERFFPLFDAHRLSSVFLEPVSLGNYVIIMTVAIAAFRESFDRRTLYFLIATNVLLLFGSDGRLAFGVCLAIVFGAPFAIRSRFSPALVLPATVLVSFAATLVSDTAAGQDNLIGRLGVTFLLMSELSVVDWLGATQVTITAAADSGLVYSILAQSIVGATALWCFIFIRPYRTLVAMRVAYGTAIYLSGTLMVSYSLYSIKTAALLWFMFGWALSQAPAPRYYARPFA